MSIIDGIKEVANVVRKADNIDLYRKILDLQQEALELVEENHKLKNEIEKLNNYSETQERLMFKDNKYYLKTGESEDGPFCTACWDNNGILVRLHKSTPYGVEMHRCPVCAKA